MTVSFEPLRPSRVFSSASPRRGRGILAALVLFLLFVLIGVVFLRSFWPSAGHAQPAAAPHLWAGVVLPKPTYTPFPTSLPTTTATHTPEPTATPGTLLMEIVPDTPTPAFAAALAPSVSTGEGKYILVDISEQHLYAYEGDTLKYSFVASTGMNHSTRVGTFAVQSKIPNAYGSTWNIWMPYWLGIYWAGGLENGIHALPILPNGAQLWAGFLGRPISYGCVVLGSYEAQLLYEWAELGTPVEIQH